MGVNLGPYKTKLIEIALQIAAKQFNLFGFSTADLAAKARSQVEFTGLPEKDIKAVLKVIESVISSHSMHND